jgi:hypothetical protein
VLRELLTLCALGGARCHGAQVHLDQIEPVLGLDIVAQPLHGALIRVAVVVPAKACVLAATSRIHCVVSNTLPSALVCTPTRILLLVAARIEHTLVVAATTLVGGATRIAPCILVETALAPRRIVVVVGITRIAYRIRVGVRHLAAIRHVPLATMPVLVIRLMLPSQTSARRSLSLH